MGKDQVVPAKALHRSGDGFRFRGRVMWINCIVRQADRHETQYPDTHECSRERQKDAADTKDDFGQTRCVAADDTICE